MARGNYNNFTPEDQKRGGQIQTVAFSNGMLVREWTCRACLVEGKVPGDIIAHLEDYTEPIDGAIWLCYRCHTVLHMRFEHQKSWDEYRRQIREGRQYKFTKSRRLVIEDFLGNQLYLPPIVNPPRESTILDEIEDGLHLPDQSILREKMDRIHREGIKFFKNRQQESLF